MLLRQVLRPEEHNALLTIADNASTFLECAGDLPLLKALPNHYDDIHRVKCRKRKESNSFVETFNDAFEEEFGDLRQRAIFASHDHPLGMTENEEPFYIFPINGFKYLYSTEVENSCDEFRTVFDSIFENLEPEQAEMTFRELLKFTYRSTELSEGIKSGAEIIIYNTPYYYAVRQTVAPKYEDLLAEIRGE